ncbi:hypothetical protein K443DRAFT_8156 [Laccaria amethystina LaAM-08-1]|uniref:Unplaced genomic scaffold K443scaffold_105, whole genome shotgun sequence n=1 Tax=Laccaria amethystina LaAM-08-1 TaxID=1095629 RepID=A0A0C9XDS3_9AGAR|nr:hypothetical protein K443DRAFT_8156 [Laccaria amethystina LaAM-08-1]
MRTIVSGVLRKSNGECPKVIEDPVVVCVVCATNIEYSKVWMRAMRGDMIESSDVVRMAIEDVWCELRNIFAEP